MGVVAVTTFVSCNNSDHVLDNAEQIKITQEDNLIERNILNLSTTDASKLAKQFSQNEYGNGSRSASNVSIKDIQTISSESGEPLMYVVNYADNKGFTVISATKNYTPVLAYSDEGYLKINDASFTDNTFMDEYKTYIESVVNEENDSLRLRYAIDWSLYEKSPADLESRTYSDTEIQQKLAEARTYYTNQGYEVHSLGAATSLIPAAGGQTAEQRANGFINDICQHTPSEYDCMDVTLLLVKRYETAYGPYISTSWHQQEPYCTDASNGLAGCATIVATQLMKYHEWPNSFNWNNIRDTLTAPLSQDETNLMNLRKEMNPQYNIGGTTISTSEMEEMLQNHGYTVTSLIYPGYTSVASEIKERRPVIMAEVNPTIHKGHGWLCDGYKYSSVQYAAYMINRDFDEYTFFSGITDHYLVQYLHMNMGWKADNNINNKIWYYYDTIKDYTANRIIIKVQPNR